MHGTAKLKLWEVKLRHTLVTGQVTKRSEDRVTVP